jgi:cytochrome c553
MPLRGSLRGFVLLALIVGHRVHASDGHDFFEKRVRPILVERCQECHEEAGKKKGGLALDSRAGWMAGGDSGAAVVPGRPDESRLIEAVRYKNRDLQMPPKNVLSDSEIKVLEEWVAMGAPDPREASGGGAKRAMGMSLAEGRKFWAFVPVKRPSVPVGGMNPIDAFLGEALRGAGVEPAPLADRLTLLRRATFDLTGLPPTPAEVDAFLGDAGTDEVAFGRVVERLLASPQYGVRWGRHWLDVVRYADSNGLDENIAFGNAWRYRDYVVDALNADRPFDQFVQEHIAGDLLPDDGEMGRENGMIATGFLALGAKVLAEPDLRKLEMDVIDEQIDTMGKAFLGMTLGCARCHDHKFDPVTQEDYYALAGIFRSTRHLADEKLGAIKYWYEHSLASPEEVEARRGAEARVKGLQAVATKALEEARAALRKELDGRAADYLAEAVRLASVVSDAEVRKVAEGAGLRWRYLKACRVALEVRRGEEVFAAWHQMAASYGAAGGTAVEAVRAHYTVLFDAARRALEAARRRDAKATAPEDSLLAVALGAIGGKGGILAIPEKAEEALEGEVLARIKGLQGEVTAAQAKVVELPSAMGVTEGKVQEVTPIHLRGSYLNLGKEVRRGVPLVMGGTLGAIGAETSGRLQLAEWISSAGHPLTARVMANRLWRWHFGRGIVATTENFGVLGDQPSHPELLDWLASELVERGWSLKAMHRLMMSSEAYRRSSTYPKRMASVADGERPDPRKLDPENRLWGRAEIRRLEAEPIRDALLAVSGRLDFSLGGKTVPLKNREFVFNHTSKDATKYEMTRRSLYIPIIRNHLYEMLEQFDHPDPTTPTGNRNSTVIAPQSLILMNSPLVRTSAETLAERIAEGGGALSEQVDEMYRRVYGRIPRVEERERAVRFVERQDEMETGNGMPMLAHSLMAANEFSYLR